MSRDRLQDNLSEQCRRLAEYMAPPSGPGLATPSATAEKLSREIYLSHGTTTDALIGICESGQLLSRLVRANARNQQLPATDIDVRMGTAHCVFFYAAPFRYPKSRCGLLFKSTLEVDRSLDGSASPFDSGGLFHPIAFPAEMGPAPDFLRKHEFPVPEHRQYLRLVMDNLFAAPLEYCNGTAPKRVGCLGLSGGDERQWTHEVRLPHQVPLHGTHLQAVIAHRSLPAADPHVESFFEWCKIEGVDIVEFAGPGEVDFQTLQRECLNYLRRKLY